MKKFISAHTNTKKSCLMTFIVLVIACELLLKVNILFMKVIGICLLPAIILVELLLLQKDKQKNNS